MISTNGFRNEYRLYKNSVKAFGKQLSEELGTRVTIIPTSRKICRKNGIKTEYNNSFNTAKFLCAVYQMIKTKGYKIPNLYIDESQLPRKFNISGMQVGNENVYGPGRLDVSAPSLVIHEEGHFLHKNKLKINQNLYSQFCSIRNIFKPFLNKKEKEIYKKDIKRAYEQGFYNDLQMDKCLKKGYIDFKTMKQFYQNPEEMLVKNAFSNVSEFIAEYFALASRGFEFSPEITAKYIKFHGPEIREIITKEETNKLMAFKNSLEM